jgi:hypothetical protein
MIKQRRPDVGCTFYLPRQCLGDAGHLASILPPTCLQFLEQSGVSRFDVKSLRERGTWHLADACQDLWVLVVGRV